MKLRLGSSTNRLSNKQPVNLESGSIHYTHKSPLVFATIDPGLGGTGIALWDLAKKKKLCNPIYSTAVSSNLSSWEMRVGEIAHKVDMLFRLHLVREVHIELPTLMDSTHGVIAAKRGDLVKLSMMAGAIFGVCGHTRNISLHAVEISSWKGQVDKSVMVRRIKSMLPSYRFVTNTTHEVDAVGIGLFIKGAL